MKKNTMIIMSNKYKKKDLKVVAQQTEDNKSYRVRI